MDQQIPCDLSNKNDQTVWVAFNPLNQELISAPSREEFERLYLCSWVASIHQRRRDSKSK